jgi:hypothetical protein
MIIMTKYFFIITPLLSNIFATIFSLSEEDRVAHVADGGKSFAHVDGRDAVWFVS